jgi:hypothetical protein
MREFTKWLLYDNQKELFQYPYANALNLLFLTLIALLLWPLDKTILAFHLAKGYWLF